MNKELPAYLEDALEAAGALLQEGAGQPAEQDLSAVDVAERTGLSIHHVRLALRLLQDLGLVGRIGRRERLGGYWSTQFYYWWIGGRK